MDRTDSHNPWAGPLPIIAMIFGFIFFWPIGLAILLFMCCLGPWSGRRNWRDWQWDNAWWNDAGTRGHGSNGDNSMNEDNNESGRQRRRHRHRHAYAYACGGSRHRSRHRRHSSGNTAFDAYREETLKRLEDEQDEFEDFLGKLRQAKDKAEFDDFMNERKNRPIELPDATEGEQPSV